MRFKPTQESSFCLTAPELAQWFLNVHSWWFVQMGNELFGQKDKCGQALVEYLAEGKYPENPNSKYVVDKFNEIKHWFTKVP